MTGPEEPAAEATAAAPATAATSELHERARAHGVATSYVDGTGGVRVEDDVLVTAQGCEVLTDVSRELLVV